MNVLTDTQLRLRYTLCLIAGILVTGIAFGSPRWFAPAVAEAAAPRIVAQTPNQTVARVPTLREGKRVDCTVTIDHPKSIWSITC